MSVKKRTNSSRKSFPTWMIRILAGTFLVGALLSAYLVYVLVRDLSASWSGTGLPSFGVPKTQSVDDAATPTIQVLETLPDPWSGNERVTILLMGIDQRDWESGEGAPRTDSMMLVTLDPVSKTAGMLSIPRDLWVEIPGYGHGRINTAYVLGEQDRLPGGGPELAIKTVEKFMGVPIHYYMQLDFGAFERMVDEIGGVEIDVPEEIEVDPILTPNITLEPGKQTLSGEIALAYARARHTEGGDFDRSARQQQVALAIRSQILRLNMIPTLVTKAPAIYQELASGIHTNLALDQMISLGLMVFQINPGNIGRAVIGPPEMVTFERVIYGGEAADVLKPVPDKIRMLRDEIFTATGAIGPSVDTGNPQAAAEDEFARVIVLNGAGQEGLAGQFADALRDLGFNVTEIANADRMDYPTTRIIDYTGNPYTTQYLVNLMDLTQSQVLFQTLPDGDVDVALVIGYDWQPLLAKLSSN